MKRRSPETFRISTLPLVMVCCGQYCGPNYPAKFGGCNFAQRNTVVFFLVILMLLLSAKFNEANGQTLPVSVIEVDSITHTIKDQVPFDRRFILKLKMAEMPTAVDYIQLKRNMTWYQTISYKLDAKFLGIFPVKRSVELNRIPPESIDTGRESSKKYAYIRFESIIDPFTKRITENNYLKPGKSYAILVTNFDEKSSAIFQSYFDAEYKLRAKSTANGEILPSDTLALYQVGDSLICEYNHKQEKSFGGLLYNEIKVANAHALYWKDLQQKYTEIKALDLKTENVDTTELWGLAQSTLIHRLVIELTNPGLRLRVPAKFIDSLHLLNNLVLLQRINDPASVRNSNFKRSLLTGKATLDKQETDAKPTVVTQIKSLQASLTSFQQIDQFAALLLTRQILADTVKEFEDIQTIEIQLQDQIIALKKKKQLQADISTLISKHAEYSILSVVEGSSVNFDFKTRSKLQIIPDFGYVWYGFQSGFSSFTPYLGFEVNFRPIDKNIPWNLYPNKTLWHYLSLSTGWSLTSIAKTGERENFFSGSSLLTGIGIKLTNAIKINTGTMWFYRNNPNPILSSRNLRCTFYTGLSLDLDIKEFLNDFTSQKPNLH